MKLHPVLKLSAGCGATGRQDVVVRAAGYGCSAGSEHGGRVWCYAVVIFNACSCNVM